MSKPTIYDNDINGMGSGGYLSVRADSASRPILEKMVKDGSAIMSDESQFDNSYGVRFPTHFRYHVDTIPTPIRTRRPPMSNPDLPITMECDMWHCQKCGAPCVDFVLMGPEEKKVCITCVLKNMESLQAQLDKFVKRV